MAATLTFHCLLEPVGHPLFTVGDNGCMKWMDHDGWKLGFPVCVEGCYFCRKTSQGVDFLMRQTCEGTLCWIPVEQLSPYNSQPQALS